jgi:hypothetical protein
MDIGFVAFAAVLFTLAVVLPLLAREVRISHRYDRMETLNRSESTSSPPPGRRWVA